MKMIESPVQIKEQDSEKVNLKNNDMPALTVFSKTIVGKILGGASKAVAKVAPIVGGAMSSVIDSIGVKKAEAKLSAAATKVVTVPTVASTVKAQTVLSDIAESATGAFLKSGGPTVSKVNDIEQAAREGTLKGFVKGYWGWILGIGAAVVFGIVMITKGRRFRR